MMCKAPNKSKITTFLRQCLTSASAKADLSALYSPSDLSVEQVELEDMRTHHVYARCNLPHLSGDTVLRDIHRMSVPERCEVKEIGVDDWAFRKGVTYGSIIVSLETGSVIDLLGDRDVKSFQAWLDEHVQVEVVSRDRSTDYTAAIAATGRNITEVADRFHLNMNMSDCVTFGRASLDLLKRKMVFSDLCFK